MFIKIDILKKKVADQDETIDDLVQERDDVYDELFKVRLTLADAWNIERATDAEKIWEVLRRTREITATQGKKKPSSAVVELSDTEVTVDKAQENKANLDSTDSVDSGLGMQSLTQLIDERVNLVVDAKLKEREKASSETNIEPISTEIMISTPVHANLDQDREQNVIIHGLKEGDLCDTTLVKGILEATATQYEPAHAVRLGQKNNETTRPLMLCMKKKIETIKKNSCRNYGCLKTPEHSSEISQ